ncbi:MAG TPA: isoprenylcysteine carboxylmethyltransferase family protein [Anaerolineales bacterium]
MTTTSRITPSGNLSGILARALQIALVLLLQGALLFLVSGRFDWTWAWVVLGIYLVSISINASFMLRLSPDTVAERGTAQLTHNWDKILSALWALMQYLIIPVVAALDVRLLWSGHPALGWHVAGAVLLAAGLGIFGWAMITNAYFSTAVRIQSERGQTVCTSGPYRLVRHPGYGGALLQSIGIPLLLGSWWALIPGLLAAAFMTARTAFEDRLLQRELHGYSDYAHRVRYRLVPGIW